MTCGAPRRYSRPTYRSVFRSISSDLSTQRWSLAPSPTDFVAEIVTRRYGSADVRAREQRPRGHLVLRSPAPSRTSRSTRRRRLTNGRGASSAKTTDSTTTSRRTTFAPRSRRTASGSTAARRLVIQDARTDAGDHDAASGRAARRPQRHVAGVRTAAAPARRRAEQHPHQLAGRRPLGHGTRADRSSTAGASHRKPSIARPSRFSKAARRSSTRRSRFRWRRISSTAIEATGIRRPPVTDYATAVLTIVVPAEFDVVASGTPRGAARSRWIR